MPEPTAIEASLAAIGNQINALRSELDELKGEKGSKGRIDELKAELDALKREKVALIQESKKKEGVGQTSVVEPDPNYIDPLDPLGLME